MKDLLTEIKRFIQFAVSEEDYEAAVDFALKHSKDRDILRLLYQHYSELPEASEQPVNCITELCAKQGVRLLLVITPRESHYYLFSNEQAVWLGLVDMEIDQEVLDFFNIENQEGLRQIVVRIQNVDLQAAKTTIKHCPVCGVQEGEYHLLGCVVEVCPWCDGHVSQCNCRFDMIGVEEITSEEELDQFEELLEKKGRIPFQRDHRPGYPGTSKGLDV